MRMSTVLPNNYSRLSDIWLYNPSALLPNAGLVPF